MRPVLASLCLALALSVPMASAQTSAPADTSENPEPLVLRFHNYRVRLPQTPGWELVRKESEKQSVTIRNSSLNSQDSVFIHGEVRIARAWYPSVQEARTPERAFEMLARREAEVARRTVPPEGMNWLGAKRDTIRDEKREYPRLWYGMGNNVIRADAWIAFWFPPTFPEDGFYYSFALQYFTQPDLKDESILQEFSEILRSAEFFEPDRDARLLPAGADSLGRASGSLPFVYYDLRMQTTATPIDTTVAPCWAQLYDSLAVEIAPTVYRPVTFFSFKDRAPAPGSREHGERIGKAFDRNGDGRVDLAFFRQGVVIDRAERQYLAFYAIADEDFDGRADAIVFEDGDQDRDGLVDHFLYGQDRTGDGRPDRLWQFDDDIAHPIKPVPKQDTRFFIGRAARPGVESFDLAAEFEDWTRALSSIDRAVEQCRK